MISERPGAPPRTAPRSAWSRWPELLLIGAVSGLLQALGPGLILALRYDRIAIAHGQWWRLWSAHLVHLGWDHWLLNMAGLAGLWWLYVAEATRRDWLIVATASALFISAALYVASPAVEWYVGLSGVLHALWAAAAVAMWRHSRTEAAASLVLLAAKLVWEAMIGPLSSGPGDGLPVVTVAHRYGALGGLGCALALRLWRKPL